MRQLTLGVQLKERATFASFLTARNQELVAHLQHVAANTPPGATWLAGPHTAGKSHLLQAVCAATPRRTSAPPIYRSRPCCLSVRARSTARKRSTSPVMTTCRSIAGLDDWERPPVLAVAARAGAQLDAAVRGARKPGARATSASRTSSRGWRPRRCSRCASSTTTNSSRRWTCARSCAGFELPAETARYLQRRFPRDMRTLCEILDTLDDAAFVAQRRITVPFIRDVIDGAAKA